jgi:NAD+ synthase
VVPDVLKLDAKKEIERIGRSVREQVSTILKRRGVVLGLSGGIDSSVCAALCVRALGPDRVVGLLMPERDSSPESLELGRAVGQWLGVQTVLEDIGPALDVLGCYRRRDDAIRTLLPEYGAGYRCKLLLTGSAGPSTFPAFTLVVESPDGRRQRLRPSADAYLAIVAATNFKQRVRKMLEYHHADRLQYAVAGTPNRLEYDQGFFVKNGDGAADLKPIAHLYKSQVYQLAEDLGVPDEIRSRTPTTDTYSLEQTQEEFFFALPLHQFDLCLYGRNNNLSVEAVAGIAQLTAEQVGSTYAYIDQRRKATRYLRTHPLFVEPVGAE